LIGGHVLNDGADDYVKAVFAFGAQRPRARASAPTATTCGTVLQVGDLTLNAAAFCVRRGMRRLSSRKEFSLLEYLMRNAGTVCRIRRSSNTSGTAARPMLERHHDAHRQSPSEDRHAGKGTFIRTVRVVGMLWNREFVPSMLQNFLSQT